MSDRERNALRIGVEAVVPDPALSRVHPAVVRGQRADGTLDVDLDEGGPAPRMSGVEPVYGLPATFCRLKTDARLHVAYKAGDPRKRIATHFPFYPPQSIGDGPVVDLPEVPVDLINICNATDNQGAARKGDDVGGGTLTWTPTPPAGGIPTGGVLAYTPFPTPQNPLPTPQTWSVVGPIVITELTPTPGNATPTITMGGAITGGSAIVKIGG